jgi:hypoxanthine phosphoribosyltransferase
MPVFFADGHRRKKALELVPRLAAFDPAAIVYVASGGRLPGTVVAEALGLPLHGLDIRYPFSRLASRVPPAVRALAWPVKEILYRLGEPRTRGDGGSLPAPGTRVILIDDSASSGKTISVAVAELARNGLERRDVLVAVLRCGRRARGVVDVYGTGAHPMRA